jgi:hypothetical protein
MIISVIVTVALFSWIAFLFSAYITSAILLIVKLITKKAYDYLEARYFKIIQIPLTVIMFFIVLWRISASQG